MSEYREEFRADNGLLSVRLSGKFPDELLEKRGNLFQPLIDACSKHDCRRALIDARDLQVDFGVTAKFRAGEDAAYLGQLRIRVAILASAEMFDRFFETVVVNRTDRVGIFTDMNEALDWLG